ncbi:MAG: ATP-binding protein [Gemmatimonadota bacterium]|nr:ATP-binding protein [Gemmatimonadota bacterium]
MAPPFIGRTRELEALRTGLDAPSPCVAIVLGRRRVGKSRLLAEATRDRPAVYYQATRVAPSLSLAMFKSEATQAVGDDPVLDSAGEWLGVLVRLEDLATGRVPGLTIVIDEFPYLCDADPALPSVFQKFCDRLRTKGSPLNLVLCGSKVSFMEGLLAEKNPLHNRHTLKLDVEPLLFRDAACFFQDWSPLEKLRAWGIFGGMPYYLTLCDPALSLEDNVRRVVLGTGAPLADEPTNLLQSELRDVSRYATILSAIAAGCTTSGEIIGRVREIADARALSPYVQVLEQLRLIRIVRSLDAGERSRDRRYQLADPFLAFWYRFCLPHASALSAGHDRAVWREAIAPALDHYMGTLFEWVCREHVRCFVQEILPGTADQVGQIWADDYDIDVAGRLLGGEALAGECKWWRRPVGVNVLERLQRSVGASGYYGEDEEPFYLIFSRAGFSEALERRREESARLGLVRAEDLVQAPS